MNIFFVLREKIMAKMKMHDDEMDIDSELLRLLLDEQFPQWAKLPILQIESAGTDNAIFQLGANMCVRMPRIISAAKNIEKEHAWLPKLAANLPLPISVPLEKGHPNENYPWHWSICRWLDGENAAIAPIADLEQCAKDLAQFLMSLWQVDCARGPRSYRAGSLTAQNDEVQTAFASMPKEIDIHALQTIWQDCLTAPAWNKPPVWTHGDLLPTNLLVSAGRLSAVIDFDLMGVGDPACDLLAAWSVLSKETRGAFRSMLGVDDATWMRGRGWALSIALIIIPYYQITNPGLVKIAYRIIDEILADLKV